MNSLDCLGVCLPRWATRRRPERPTVGGRVAEVARLLGREFMPWQRYVADVAGEIDPGTGLPCYRDVILSVPRQSGKTLLMWAVSADRCIAAWPGGARQTVAWTAQTGSDGRKKWTKDLLPMTRESALSAAVSKITEGMGNEAVEWLSESTINLLSTKTGSGHSLSVDLAMVDELWNDHDERRDQALRPAMSTKSAGQMWSVSTMGNAASTAWNRKRDLGRSSVDDDVDSGVCYFEWSSTEDGWDPTDPGSWASFMPALGHTITEDVVVADLRVMEPDEAKRAYGNITLTIGGDRLIPPELWRRVSHRAVEVGEGRGFGLAVTEDRSMAAIAVADADGNVELVEHRPGTKWVVDRCDELTDRWGGTVAVDASGPAGSLAAKLKAPLEVKGNGYVRACQAFYDGIVEATIGVRSDPALDAAAGGVVRKNVGDSFVWSRKSSTADVSPLEAATLAIDSARNGGSSNQGFAEVMT